MPLLRRLLLLLLLMAQPLMVVVGLLQSILSCQLQHLRLLQSPTSLVMPTVRLPLKTVLPLMFFQNLRKRTAASDPADS